MDLNATQAAVRAGYSAATAEQQGPRLLGHVGVAARIAELQAERAERIQIDQDRVLRELATVGLSSIEHYVLDDDGYVILAAGAPPDALRAVSSIKRKRRTITKGDDTIVEVDTELRLWPKVEALAHIGKHLGMFIERQEMAHSGELAIRVVWDDPAAEALGGAGKGPGAGDAG